MPREPVELLQCEIQALPTDRTHGCRACLTLIGRRAKQNELSCVSASINEMRKHNFHIRRGRQFRTQRYGGDQKVTSFVVSAAKTSHRHRPARCELDDSSKV